MANNTSKKIDQLSNGNYMIVMALITLLVLGGAFLGGKMLLSDIVRDTKVLGAKNLANKQLDENLQNAPRLVNNYENLGSNRVLIENALPNTSDLPGLIALLENMGGSVGIAMKSVSPSLAITAAAPTPAPSPAATPGAATGATAPVSDVAVPQPYTVSLAFDGSFAALQGLLAAVEKSARPIRITDMQLSGSGTTLAIQMSATTYYQDKAKIPFKTEKIK